MNIIQDASGYDIAPLVQFLKYAIAGVIANVVHIIVFHLGAWKLFPALQDGDLAVKLLKLPISKNDNATRSRNSMISNAIAFVFANFVAYVINVYWVFEPGRYSWIVEISLFYLVSGTSVALGTVLMGLLIRRYGILTTYAFVTNIVTALMINYAMRKFFIFKG